MNESALRIYRAPLERHYFLCRTRWLGTRPVHEHARLVDRRVKWFRHPAGWRLEDDCMIPFDALLVVLSVLQRQQTLERRRARRRRARG